MEPIISPWTIYLINLTHNISQLLLAISTMCLIFSVAATLILIFSYVTMNMKKNFVINV